jgi:putative peptidoglycan lipid II flippase
MPEQQTDDSPGSEADAKPSIGRRMGIAALILSASIFLSRILGFLREAVIAYTHGASVQTDAYYAAFTLPDLMSYFLAGGTLSITFIPLFSAFVTNDDEEGGWRLFSTVATTMGSVLVCVTIAMELLAPMVVPLLVPGFDDPGQMELAIRMTRIVIPAQLCFYFGGLLQATLFVKEVFWPAAIAPLIYNICIIAGGVLLDPFIGIQGFSVGVVVGALLGPLGLPLWASRREVKFRFRFAPRDPGFRKFILLTLPLMVGVGLVTVDEWLLRYFGSSHADGAITWLNNSRKLMLVLFAIIGQAAGQAALPFLTRLYHEGKETEMGEMLSESVGRVVFLAAIGACGLAVAAKPIVWIIFRRGEFDASDAAMTATLLVCFAAGLASWSAQTMSARGFYARKDTLTPMLVATGVVAIAVPVYFVLDEQYGVVGLAAATSIGMTLNAIATITAYRLKTKALPLGPVLSGLGRGAVTGGVCAAAAWGGGLLYRTLVAAEDFWTYLGLGVSQGICFGIVLLVVAWVFSPPELAFAMERVKRRLKR